MGFIYLFIFNSRDQQVRLDKRENVDTLDPRDHLVSKVCLELQEKKEPR